MRRFLFAIIAAILLPCHAVMGNPVAENTFHNAIATIDDSTGHLDRDEDIGFGSGGQADAFAVVIPESGSVDGAAQVTVTGSPAPGLYVEASLHADAPPDSQVFPAVDLGVLATASLIYEFVLFEDQSPPISVNILRLPVFWEYILVASAFEANDNPEVLAGADADLRINSYREGTDAEIVFGAHVQADNGGINPDFEVEPLGDDTGAFLGFLPLNRRYEVVMDARAFVGDNSIKHNVNSSVSAFVDPVLRFDQAAFDEMYGSNTFPLEDYYSFRFSPGISNVPEPSTALMLCLGLLLLGGRGQKRCQGL